MLNNLKIPSKSVYANIMEPGSPSTNEQNEEKNDENPINIARIEAMVTPEQVHSASVAKKRRTFTKRRSAQNHDHQKRDPTPLKLLNDDDHTVSTEEEQDEEAMAKINRQEQCEEKLAMRPKTPERRRRKRVVNKLGDEKSSKSEPEITDYEEGEKRVVTVRKSNSFSRQLMDELKTGKEKYADMAQAEVVSFLNKTKKNLAAAANRGRDRFKKAEKEQKVKRSQSAPHSFTQEELIASFRKAQLLDSENGVIPRKEEVTPVADKPMKELVESFKEQKSEKSGSTLRQRKKRPPASRSSTKIVEILDPRTSNVVAMQSSTFKPDFRFWHLVGVLRQFSLRELRDNFKIFKIDMKDECGRIRRLKNRCMCELFLIMVFCGLGGFIFRFVEGTFENFYKCGVKRVKRDFIDLLWMKSHNLREDDWKSLARTKLRVFEEELHAAHEAGMKTYSGQRSWSFLNAVVYSLSIVTTIGYGHIYPETRTGKALTLVYAIIGIPLFLLALTDFGKLFTRCIKFLWSFVRRLYYTGSCRTVRKTAHVKEILHGAQMMYEIATFRRPSTVVDPENPEAIPDPATLQIAEETPTTPAISNFEIDDEFNLPISLAIFILILYIFCGGLIYCFWEGWDFFDSFYFVFISMSTVGFGDMVPDDPACMIVSIVYLVFGLALTSMCINVVQVKLSDTFKQASSKIGATIGIDVAEEDGSIQTVPVEKIEMPPVHDEQKSATTTTPSTLSPNNIVQVNNNDKQD